MKKLLKGLGYLAAGIFIVFNVLMLIQAYSISRFHKLPKSGKPPVQHAASLIFTGLRMYRKPVDTLPPLPFSTVKLVNNAGQRLEGWYIPAASARGTVLLFHGHGSVKSKIIPEMLYFHKLGYNTFSIDFRAHGNSEGEQCTIGYKETGDILAAYNWVKQRGEQHIIMYGVSMGAASLLKALPEYGLKPEKLILECPFASMQEAVAGFLRKMHLPAAVISQELTFWGSVTNGIWGFGFKPAAYAKKITVPVLLNWGAKDNRVLANETQLIFRNLASRQKKLVVFYQSGHQSYCRNEPAKWKSTIASFLYSIPAETTDLAVSAGK